MSLGTIIVFAEVDTGELGARTGNGTITIANATKNIEYKAYRVFDATLGARQDRLDGFAAYAGFYGGITYSIPAEHKELVESSGLFDLFPNSADGYTITKKETAEDSAIITWVKENYATLSEGKTVYTAVFDDSSNTAVFEDIPYGYYYITSGLGSAISIDSTYPDALVYDKNSTEPDLNKLITAENGTVITDTELQKHNYTDIGSTETFTISSNVYNWVYPNGAGDPKMARAYTFTDNYQTGFYKIDRDSFKVRVGDLVVYENGAAKNNSGVVVSFSDTATRRPDGAPYQELLSEIKIMIPWVNAGAPYIDEWYYDEDENVWKFYDGPDGEMQFDTMEEMLDYLQSWVTDQDILDQYILHLADVFKYTDQTRDDGSIPITITYDVECLDFNIEGISKNWVALDYTYEDGTVPVDEDEVTTQAFKTAIVKYGRNDRPWNNNTNINATPLLGAKFKMYRYERSEAYVDGEDQHITVDSFDDEHLVHFVQTGMDSDFIYYRLANSEDSETTDTIDLTTRHAALIYGIDDTAVYYYVETQAPAGYNALTKPINLTGGNGSVGYNASAGRIYSNQINILLNVAGDASISGGGVFVTNFQGVVLPSTGGVGTTIFYVVGSILVVAAGVLLITKKRMGRE